MLSMRPVCHLLLRLFLLAWGLLPGASVAEDVLVRIERVGDEFVLEGGFHVAVPPAVAWAVLTDYDGMPRFVEDLRESRVIERQGDRLRVVQRGVTRLGPFSFDYDVEREVVLDPEHAVHSRALRGNVKKLDMHTFVESEGDGTRIRFRAAMIPDFWVPPLVGPRLIRTRFERQFESLLKEMRRRAEGAGR
jgi:carbon monoxide dehydrogenase subunit G